jgi:hypothetical protein
MRVEGVKYIMMHKLEFIIIKKCTQLMCSESWRSRGRRSSRAKVPMNRQLVHFYAWLSLYLSNRRVNEPKGGRAAPSHLLHLALSRFKLPTLKRMRIATVSLTLGVGVLNPRENKV